MTLRRTAKFWCMKLRPKIQRWNISVILAVTCVAIIIAYSHMRAPKIPTIQFMTLTTQHAVPLNNSSPKTLFSSLVQTLRIDMAFRRLHWNKVEFAVDSPVPSQFQSVGFYDTTLKKFKFYFTGFAENKPMYCRLYLINSENRVIAQLFSVDQQVTDSERIMDRDIAAGVAMCDKIMTNRKISLVPVFQDEMEEPILGVLTYSSVIPGQTTIKAQLLDYLQHGGVSLLARPQSVTSTTPHNASVVSEPSVVVCVKATTSDPDHPMNPVVLVEWLEYTRLFKAHHVVFYAYSQGPRSIKNDTLKVLRYYQSTGFLDLWMTDYILVSDNATLGWTITLFLHAPSLNLCVDYNRHKFHYVAVYDIDEIWVPLLDDSYPSLIARLTTQHGHRPFTFTNWLFFTELPHTTNDSSVPISQRYFYRANMSHISWKTVSPMSQCFVPHCHYCVRTYPNSSERYRVPEHVAVLHHHTYCWNHRPSDECELALSEPFIVRDELLLRYSAVIGRAINLTMQEMIGYEMD